MTVTPAVMARHRPPHRPLVGRRQLLLDTIRATGGTWTSGRVKALYRKALPTHVYRSNIRADLRVLFAAGHLELHLDAAGRRFYTYAAKGDAS